MKFSDVKVGDEVVCQCGYSSCEKNFTVTRVNSDQIETASASGVASYFGRTEVEDCLIPSHVYNSPLWKALS